MLCSRKIIANSTHMYPQGTEGKWEVRGCCFKHTAHNEQHMCEVVASVLEKEEMCVGNRALCVWHYSIPGGPVDVVSSNMYYSGRKDCASQS